MYKSIQYLRGVAAVAVVIKHAAHPGGRIDDLLAGGVDLFFIISGFVMVVSTQGSRMRSGEFLLKRAARIFPIWWLALGTAVILQLADGSFIDQILSFALIPTSLSFGVGHVSWGVGWTLVFEMLFYLIFATGLAIRSEWFAVGVIFSLAAFGHIFGHSYTLPIVRDLTSSIMLEFVFGMLIARFAPPLAIAPALIAILLAALLLLLPSWPLTPRSLCLGAPIGLLVFAVVGLERKYGTPNIGFLQFFGDASYSIYLFHYMAIFLLWHVVGENAYWPITAAAGIAFGSAIYISAERPIQTIVRNARHALSLRARNIQ